MLFHLYIIFLVVIFVKGGLYNSSDPLTILDYKNFDTNVINSNHGWIIEFYNSWCGHCISYAPTWRKFSDEVKDWDHTFKVGVIDCAEDDNIPTCRDYEIMGYPSVRIFNAFTKKGDLGTEVESKEITKMQISIINFIADKEIENLGSNSWVDLRKYNASVEELMKKSPAKAKKVVLIFETTNSSLGGHAIMDLGHFSEVYIRRADADSKSANMLNLTAFPSVVIIDREGNRKVMHADLSDRQQFTSFIRNELNLQPRKTTTSETPDNQKEKDHDLINGDRLSYSDDLPDNAFNSAAAQVYLVDIENALSYALRHEVRLHSKLSGVTLNALKQFLAVCVKYLPVRPHVLTYLSNLKNFLGLKSKFTAREYDMALVSAQAASASLPEKQSWVGCQGSKPNLRGFTCGLWTLFHALTVNAAIKEQDTSASLTHSKTLPAIHGYVKHYFSCQHCSTNFQQMYKEDGGGLVKEGDRAALWLWKAHNKVNLRIKGELSEDPKHPKVQFPLKSACGSCWVNDGKANEAEILKFLKKFYGPSSMSEVGVLTVSYSPLEAPRNRQVQVFEALNKAAEIPKERTPKLLREVPDINLCIVLYGLSFCIILGGYFFFNYRKHLRRKRFLELYKRP